jgi:outer membrane protein TolC
MSPRSFVSALLLFATACAVGPDYEEPRVELPASWRQPTGSGLANGAPVDGPFWRSLGDPLLDQLVEQALVQNLDLRASFARLMAARALRGAANADYGPRLDGRGSYEYRRESRNTPFGAFIREPTSTRSPSTRPGSSTCGVACAGRSRRRVRTSTPVPPTCAGRR